MAKTKEKKSTYPYPSRYGSSKSMQIGEEDNSGFVICKDEFGEYKTEEWRLDNGLIDPNRTTQTRLSPLFGGKKDKND